MFDHHFVGILSALLRSNLLGMFFMRCFRGQLLVEQCLRIQVQASIDIFSDLGNISTDKEKYQYYYEK